jgi:hypothetical protein
MFTPRIPILAAVLFAALPIGGISAAGAATAPSSAYHQTVGAARMDSATEASVVRWRR